MNQTALEDAYIPTLMKAADRLAHVLCDGARAGLSRKQLLATLTQQTRSIRGCCLKCAAEWPLMLLGREQARHICVVARRASFVSLRRRLEEHFRKIPLRCPECAACEADRGVSDAAGLAESGRHETGDSPNQEAAN